MVIFVLQIGCTTHTKDGQKILSEKILERIYSERKSLYEAEQRWMDYIKPSEIKVKYFNLTNKVKTHWTASNDEYNKKTIKEKISIKTKEAMSRPEIRVKVEKYYDEMRGKPADPSRIEKMRISITETMAEKFPVEERRKRLKRDDPALVEVYRQKTIEMWESMSDETKEKRSKAISERNKGKQYTLGYKHDPASVEKRVAKLRGKKFTEEHKAKLRGPRKKRTEEEKKAQSERIKAWWATKKASQE
jgi:hypothetical protein